MPSVVPFVRTIVCAIRRVEEGGGLRARAFVERGRALAEQVRRAVDVGVGVAIVRRPSPRSTDAGFWLVFALSRYTSGLPCTRSDRIGKSVRTFCTSKLTAGALMVLMVCGRQVPIELHEQFAKELCLQMLDADALEHLTRVGVNQQVARLPRRQPAGFAGRTTLPRPAARSPRHACTSRRPRKSRAADSS